MSEFDPYSRRELRRLRRAWLQRNGRLLAGAAGGTVVMLGFATAFLLRFADGPVGWYAVGALHVGIVAAVLHLLHAAFLAQDPRALPHVRGAWGE
ncbi:hypothetical protein [Nocardioides caldifontis]|uniref:hypothetical protein n=1 Tax=Nocardioides caldifontis TaxID=2588938 RepID=UPI0011E03979|nr:hypothetical protein [Nocardioides caldifontis]